MKRVKYTLFSTVFFSLTLFIPGKSVISKEGNSGADTTSMNAAQAKIASPLYTLELIPDFVPQENIIKAGLLYDVETRKIVWEKNMNVAFPIASLTKMMVALLTLEDLKEEKITWDTKVKISREACMMGGSKINLRYGESLTIQDLMKSAMIASSNDAAFMLGQFLGGTATNFVARMNARAASLGMSSTFFSNPTGLPSGSKATDNHASPTDLLILATELLKFPELIDISRRDNEPVLHGIRTTALRNHNRLVATYKEEVDGIKTGFTNNAGFCIVATSNRKNHRLISIVLGASRSYVRNTIVAGMLNDYYAQLGLGKMGENEDAGTLVQNEDTEE